MVKQFESKCKEIENLKSKIELNKNDYNHIKEEYEIKCQELNSSQIKTTNVVNKLKEENNEQVFIYNKRL